MPPFLILLFTLAQVSTAEVVVSSNEVAAAHTEQYRELEEYLDKLIAKSENVRAESWKRDFSSVEAYEKSVAIKRDELWRLLGGKPADPAPLAPKEELIADFDTHRASRVWLGAFDKVRAYGILLVPRGKGPFPALICIHGMSGAPEAVAGLTEKPDYHNRYGLEAVKRGYVVFAPLDINTQQQRRWLDRKALLVATRLQSVAFTAGLDDAVIVNGLFLDDVACARDIGGAEQQRRNKYDSQSRSHGIPRVLI